MNTNIFILGSEGGLEPPSLSNAMLPLHHSLLLCRGKRVSKFFGTLRTLRLAFRVPFMSREEWGGVPHRRLYYYNNVR